jgi:hypothetical protein
MDPRPSSGTLFGPEYRPGSRLGQGNFNDLPLSRRITEAVIRDIEVPIWTEGHCRGQRQPVAITVIEWRPSIRTTCPVPGVGKGLPIVFSSAWSWPLASYARPTRIVKLMSTVVRLPSGVIFIIFDEPSRMENQSRLPTRKFSP